MSDPAAIVLAAGKSTRMKSDRPKVLHEILGRPMLSYVLDACFDAGVPHIHVVVGHGREQVVECFADDARLTFVDQTEQLGTGHAVMSCAPCFREHAGDVLIIAGDMPLVRARTLRALLVAHRQAGAVVSLATAELPDPDGYGRIVRDDRGALRGIVEHRNCTPQQRRIHEVNISYYCFAAGPLFEALRRLQPDPDKGEYYITDAVEMLVREQGRSAVLPGVPSQDALGINSPSDLQHVEDCMRERLAQTRSG